MIGIHDKSNNGRPRATQVKQVAPRCKVCGLILPASELPDHRLSQHGIRPKVKLKKAVKSKGKKKRQVRFVSGGGANGTGKSGR